MEWTLGPMLVSSREEDETQGRHTGTQAMRWQRQTLEWSHCGHRQQRGRAEEGSFLGVFRGSVALLAPESQPAASRTTRESISAVWSHQVWQFAMAALGNRSGRTSLIRHSAHPPRASHLCHLVHLRFSSLMGGGKNLDFPVWGLCICFFVYELAIHNFWPLGCFAPFLTWSSSLRISLLETFFTAIDVLPICHLLWLCSSCLPHRSALIWGGSVTFTVDSMSCQESLYDRQQHKNIPSGQRHPTHGYCHHSPERKPFAFFKATLMLPDQKSFYWNSSINQEDFKCISYWICSYF